MLTVLRQRNFGLLWTAGLISLIGDWAFYGVMPVYVLDRTDSVFYSGLTWSLIAFPQVIFGPLFGVFADRHNRQRIMFMGNIGQAVAMAVLLIVGGNVGIWFAMLVILSASLLATLISPAENALLPTVVPEQDLTTANALNALNDNIARIAGPFIGVLLYAWIDIRGTALVNLLSFVLAATLISLVLAPSPTFALAASTGESVWKAMSIGGRHVRESPVLRTVFLLQALIAFADGPLTAALAPFVRQTLHRSASDFGVFLSMRGVAGVIGGLFFAQFARRLREDRVLIVSFMVLGVGIIGLALLRNFWIIIGLMVLVGPVFVALNTVIPTLLQRASADAWRGRMFALYAAMAGGIYALSTLLGAIAGQLTSPPLVMLASGSLYLVAGTVAWIRLPRAFLSLMQRSEPDSPVYSET